MDPDTCSPVLSSQAANAITISRATRTLETNVIIIVYRSLLTLRHALHILWPWSILIEVRPDEFHSTNTLNVYIVVGLTVNCLRSTCTDNGDSLTLFQSSL